MKSFLFQRGFILPVTVTGVVPLVIFGLGGVSQDLIWPLVFAGILLFILGISMLVWTTQLFANHDGSLAPWNPPTELVLVGPYRYCRNPMISGVYAMLLAEVLMLQSIWIVAWCLLFIVGMTSHIVFQEEPALQERFGQPYKEYCKNVPRWIPKTKPYLGSSSS